MRWILVATALLVMASGVPRATRAYAAYAPQKNLDVATADDKSEATVMLVVRGMMKSKSGAT